MSQQMLVTREHQFSQICAYADDIVIVSRTQKKLTEVYLDLEDETSKLGMGINEKKAKYTGCHRRKGPNFGRVFLMLNYTDITQNTYIQS